MPANELNRASDFRYIYADALGIQIKDDVGTIYLGITESSEDGGSIFELSAVVTTLKRFKILSIIMKEALEAHEIKSGNYIEVTDKDLQGFREALKNQPSKESDSTISDATDE